MPASLPSIDATVLPPLPMATGVTIGPTKASIGTCRSAIDAIALSRMTSRTQRAPNSRGQG